MQGVSAMVEGDGSGGDSWSLLELARLWKACLWYIENAAPEPCWESSGSQALPGKSEGCALWSQWVFMAGTRADSFTRRLTEGRRLNCRLWHQPTEWSDALLLPPHRVSTAVSVVLSVSCAEYSDGVKKFHWDV